MRTERRIWRVCTQSVENTLVILQQLLELSTVETNRGGKADLQVDLSILDQVAGKHVFDYACASAGGLKGKILIAFLLPIFSS